MNMTEPKPGPKTTEFWITVALIVLATIAGMIPTESPWSKIIAAILAGAAVLGYNVSRGIVKSNSSSKNSDSQKENEK